MESGTEPRKGLTTRVNHFVIGFSILGAVAIGLLLNWGICTNAFGFSAEAEHRMLLVGFAGWASMALARSDKNWGFLLISFGAVLFLVRELVASQEPFYFGASIATLVGIILFDILFLYKGEQSILITTMQVIFILFMTVTTALLGAHFFAPQMSQQLQASAYYGPLVASRIILSCLFIGIAVVIGVIETWKKEKPSFVERTSTPQKWAENPRTFIEWALLPFLIAHWIVSSVLAVAINITLYFWRLLVFIVFETGKEAAIFARQSLQSSLWKPLARVGATAVVFLCVVVVSDKLMPSLRHVIRSSQSRLSDFDTQLLWAYGFVVLAYSLAIGGVGLLAVAWRSRWKAWERAGVTGVSLLLSLWLAQWISLIINVNFDLHPVFFRSLGLFMVVLGVILALGLVVGGARRKTNSPI